MAWSILFLGLSLLLLHHGDAAIDYKAALTKSILYFEAQRSGKLPSNQRVTWRGDSGLRDGADAGVDLVGGYYDAGDNVKFGFPMAFTVTMLSWSVVDSGKQLSAKEELSNALDTIKWGTDYLIKAHVQPNVLYGEVGDGDSDHSCWMRPEDMTTPRTAYKIDDANPGSDLAGETAAAMAAASIAFQYTQPKYSALLLTHAKQLFDFAQNHIGQYQNSIPVVQKFYSSSGYEDELLWAAAWLYRATGDQIYLDHIGNSGNTGGTRTMFSWDDKFVGAQVLISKLILEGKVSRDGVWGQYKSNAEQFICNCIQKGSNNVKMSPGGLLWWDPWNDLQYTTSALLVVMAYSDYLTWNGANIQCSSGLVHPADLISFSHSQVEHILGANPKNLSYMVGFGDSYPLHVHHRGASIVSIKTDPKTVTCSEGFNEWFYKNAPNPNVLEGAIVGGPDANDSYDDSRTNFQQAEPATATVAPFVGVLARLA